jgi:hypothetical protein
MADTFQKKVFEELQLFIQPVVDTDGDPQQVVDLFMSIGWNLENVLGATQLQNLATAIHEIAFLATNLQTVISDPPADLPTLFVKMTESVVPMFTAVQALSNVLPTGLPAEIQELPLDLLQALTSRYVFAKSPALFYSLELLGVINRLDEIEQLHNGNVFRVKNAIPAVQFDQLEKLFKDPSQAVYEKYWPGGLDDDGQGAIDLAIGFLRLLTAFGFFSGNSGGISGELDDRDLELWMSDDKITLRKELLLDDYSSAQTGIELAVLDANAGGPGVAITPKGTWQISQNVGSLMVVLEGSIGSAPLKITDAGLAPLDPAAGTVAGKLTLQKSKDGNTKLFLFGDESATHISLQDFIFSIKGLAGHNDYEFGFGIALEDLVIQIAAEEGDGFLQTILPDDGIRSEIDLEVEWTNKGGVVFRGGSLEIMLPIHITLGPIEIQSTIIALKPDTADFQLDAGATVKANLGPLVGIVEDIGLRAIFSFPSGGGNLGLLDFDLVFKPPNGIGLVINAEVVKGGGYLKFDFEKEEYSGAFELDIAGLFSVKAVGIIATKMPDGSKGFTLLVIITAEFGTGIQLGLGFTLLGVGGLLGLNRIARLDVLCQGIRTGSINRIMFPTHVVANAPTIIRDLQTYFPPEKDEFIIGPMVKLGWGTPTLVSLSMGVIIQFPSVDIAIVGVLKVALPDEDFALMVMHVAFMGAMEPSKERAWFYANLFESRVLFQTFSGGMGVLVEWGANASFVISVGGFHPQFSPPPLPFPVPARVSIDIVNYGIALIRVMGYFAVTSNSVQFGARAELRFGVDDFGISGHVSFDALFQFSPFYFIIQISGSLSVKVFGVGLFSVSMSFSLEGPTPWRVRGRGSISILFFSIGIDFDITFGERRVTTLPPIDVMPLLKSELEKDENWTAEIPSGSNLQVSLRTLTGSADKLVLHPVGQLRISQRAVPLDLTISKVGNQKPRDAKRFTIDVGNEDLSKIADTTDSFAIAQFQDFPDMLKVSLPAFQPENSGLVLSVKGEQLGSSRFIKRNVRYELVTIDIGFKRGAKKVFRFSATLFQHFIQGCVATKSTLSLHHKQQMQPFVERIEVKALTYVVARNEDNRPFTNLETSSFSSEATARQYMQQQIALDPNLAKELHVIPLYEVNTNE